ncbi:MAG TPA: VWA domain-containing protein [Herpetosiphonaceae bacterium]
MLKRLSTLMLLLAVVLAGCSGSNNGGSATSGPGATAAPSGDDILVTITYSPEKEAWLKERIDVFNSQNKQVNGKRIVVQGQNKSSGAARTELRSGALKTTVWSPSASSWLEVLKQEANNPQIAEPNPRPLVLTPVVISMWKPMAEALGWPGKQIGWRDLLALINDPEGWGKFGHPEWGRFSWGHTDPEISTTALSTVIAEIYAATQKTDNLTVADVQAEASQQFLRDLAQGIKHYGYNTLVFSDNMQKYGMTYISAFPMEEITLIEFNKKGPQTPLVAIYPSDGTFIHDDPFIVMSNASADEKAGANQLYDFLLNDESQRLAMGYGFRPANVNVPLAEPLTPQFGVDPAQPKQALPIPGVDVIVAAKNAWANNRKPANVMLVIDRSGSMNDNNKIEEAKNGADLFLGRLPAQDNIGLIAFDDVPEVLVPLKPRNENINQLQVQVQGLIADGKTSLFDSLELARQELEKLNQRDRINAIVVLSDGADTASVTNIEQLKENFGESSIQIFPIAYGADADKAVLGEIADFSRTLLVEGSTGDINTIFENLSRYF